MVAVLALCACLVSCSGKTETAAVTLDTSAKEVSYALGMDIGAKLKELDDNIDMDAFSQGMRDAFSGAEALLTEEKALDVRMTFMKEMQEKAQQEMIEAASSNQKAGEDFFTENSTKDGVITTASGLQYIILEEGDGPMPKATDIVTVHYRGSLLDGTEFDSSYKRGEPAQFPLNRVIPGWTEGLQLMKVGSKAKLFIPSALGYGQRGSATIPPNSTLVFEVELLDKQDAPPAPPAGASPHGGGGGFH